jgi:hypothetical protein
MYVGRIFVHSTNKKRVLLFDITVPWKTNISKDLALKINRYYELTNFFIRNNYTIYF